MAWAGLYLSTERYAELPSQWRGFLNDLRLIRSVAIKPGPSVPESPLRQEYEKEVRRLRDNAKQQPLVADETADLGALLVRLGEFDAALEVLRPAQRAHPNHHAIAANIGAAWQGYGDLERAAEALRSAVALAPDGMKNGEKLHLHLVEQRLAKQLDELDHLFSTSFSEGSYAAGPWPAEQLKKLPPHAIADVQQLLLWLPFDGRLYWQMAELANAYGDVRMASELFESCVSQFNLTNPVLRQHRQTLKAAVAAQSKKDANSVAAANVEHQLHPSLVTFRSKRPLLSRRFDVASLPPLNPDGVNTLPWGLLAETTLDRNFRPTFAKRLREMDGMQVTLAGFMQPITEDQVYGTFMLIEFPTGCWYCEMPEVTGIVLVELGGGKTTTFGRQLVKVTGKLKLNATDPEDFIYTISEAKVSGAD